MNQTKSMKMIFPRVTMYTTVDSPSICARPFLLTPDFPALLIRDPNIFKDPEESALRVWMTHVSWHAPRFPDDAYLSNTIHLRVSGSTIAFIDLVL